MSEQQTAMDRRGFVVWGAAAALAATGAVRGQDPVPPKPVTTPPVKQDPPVRPGQGGRLTRDDDPRTQVVEAVCVLSAASGSSVAGWVRFSRGERRQVTVKAEIRGLKPGQQHAIHVHEFGDLRAANGTAAGEHYDPEKKEHGLLDQVERHAGDFGNLQADAEGLARLELTLDTISINGRRNPVLGRAIIVHEKADDGSQPSGNAGARIAQGVIGVANAAWMPS